MTDKEFIEMTGLFDSLIKQSGTLRRLFPGKVADKVRSQLLFNARWAYLNHAESQSKDLVGLINGCGDWTSDKYKASEIYRRMREFVSTTSDMPKGISGMYNSISSLCEKPMAIIPGVYPDLYPQIIRDLLTDEYYQIAVNRGDITPPFTWNRTIKDLAFWIEENITEVSRPKSDLVEGKEERRNWMLVDRVFLKDGKPVTAEQLRNAFKG